MQVDDYPTLLFYRAGDKSNPVSSKLTSCFLQFYVLILYGYLIQEICYSLQIKLSTKSSLKDLAGSINKHLKARDKVAKDEL